MTALGTVWEPARPDGGPEPERIRLTGALQLACGARVWRYRTLDRQPPCEGLIASCDLAVHWRPARP